jgi:hypothetical protein
MEKYYDKMNAIVKEFGYEKLTQDQYFDYFDDEDSGKYDKNIPMIDLINRIKIIPEKDIYTYLTDTIQRFIPTWYGRKIILFFDPLDINHYNYNRHGTMMSGLDNVKFNYESCCEDYVRKDFLLDQLNINLIFPENMTVKYKFLYNYAKAMFKVWDNIIGQSFTRTQFNSMTMDEKKIMISFLNKNYIRALKSKTHKNMVKQFNVMSFANYYERTYSNSTVLHDGTPIFTNVPKINQTTYITGIGKFIGCTIFDIIRDNLIDIIYEALVMKGTLSEFKLIPQVTNNKYLGNTYDDKINNRYDNMKKYIFTPSQLSDYKNNAFYFLTNKPYSELNEIHRTSKKNYFDLLTSEYKWFTFYSMDWVTQINFFHKYINNRVIFITGATGQGKSTQIPKLFMYGLKMIDHKLDGKIICSQPRVAPTRDNSEQISWELGVPIKEVSLNLKQKIKTFNSYVQYKTQDDSHIVEPHYGLLLKLVTDRLLYMTFFENPLFKKTEKPYIDDKTSECVEFNVYKNENEYDIIMVDESHEHNTNMDLILTMARDTVKYNNSLKLVIISATMKDDEPIYRRYYKEIDDNFAHPYNFINPQYYIDRFVIDRRIHISPPGETTQFIVSDFYLDHEPTSYQEAEQIALQKVMQIATDPNSHGDILFFSLSANDIRKLCKLINSTLPSSSEFICLPFYREVPSRWLIFNNLSKEVKKINIHREDIFDDMYPTIDKNPRKVPSGTYKRTIIVATNIAEASITVNSLKYIIDTGYYISVSNDPYSDEPKIDVKKISESSRIQRRGRVGRVSPGIVYYIYTKDSRMNIKSDFKICLDDISAELYDLAPRIYNDDYIISRFNWLSGIHQRFSIPKLVEKLKQGSPYIVDSNLLNNLISKQYSYMDRLLPSLVNLISIGTIRNLTFKYFQSKILIDGRQLRYYMFGLNQLKTYNLITNRASRLISGYDIKSSLYDPFGTFYVVHPEENNIKRNILTGEIISVKKYGSDKFISTDQIISHKIHIYVKKCFSYNLFINNNLQFVDNNIFRINDTQAFDNINFEYDKSTFGRIAQQMIVNFKLHDSLFINRALFFTLLYSYICDIDHIVMIMIMLLYLSDYHISGLNKDYHVYETLYDKNDLYIYYKLASSIYNDMSKYINKSNNSKEIEFIRLKDIFIQQKNEIKTNLKNKTNYWNLNMDLLTYDKFNTLANQNKLNSKTNLSDYIMESSKNINNNILSIYSDILKSHSIQIDSTTSIKAFKYYIDMKTQFDKLKNIDNIPNMANNLLWFKYHMPIRKNTDEWTNIKKALIYGFGLFQTVI